jgi:AcrR family transcriptional regulator
VKVTTGAFFHHFGSKEELGFAVIDRHMEKRRQLLEQIEKRLPLPDEDDPLQLVCRRDKLQLKGTTRCRVPSASVSR